MRYDIPCLKNDWKYAFLIDDKHEHIVIDGIEMTAKNVWEYEGSREELVEKLVDYFYITGPKFDDSVPLKKLENELNKLCKADEHSVMVKDGSISNSSRIGLDICRVFCQKSFYATRVNGTASIYDVYNNKDLLRRILKNRLGWYTTTEKLVLDDGTVLEGEHPYLFDISHKMVIQGAHSSMVSANVSNFRPLVAKYLMSEFCPKHGKVLDMSAGWGARMMAAASLGLSYYGIDPMTAKELVVMAGAISKCSFPGNGNVELKVVENVSENEHAFKSIPYSIDYAIVCPPYFKLEEYSCEKNSTDVYPDYNDWLEKYWRKTVANMNSRLSSNGKFTLIMVDKWGKYELLKDMSHIVEEEGFKIASELHYKTTRSHLTDKRTSKNTNKSTEKVLTFERTASN